MGKFFNKLRQVFNIFLISALIAAVTAVFLYFLTTPEQRGATFWLSIGFLAAALIIETLNASGIAMRSNKGQNIPVSFTKFILGAVYFLAVIALSIWNAFAPFTTVKYLLAHIGVLVVFLIPMGLINMAELKLSSAESKAQSRGRAELTLMAARVGYIVDDLRDAGVPVQSLSQLMRFSESLRYSDPTPASGAIERNLEDAITNLQETAKSGDITEIQKACTLAERALRERNEAVLSAK